MQINAEAQAQALAAQLIAAGWDVDFSREHKGFVWVSARRWWFEETLHVGWYDHTNPNNSREVFTKFVGGTIYKSIGSGRHGRRTIRTRRDLRLATDLMTLHHTLRHVEDNEPCDCAADRERRHAEMAKYREETA